MKKRPDDKTIVMVGISIVLLRGNSSSELSLIFIYFSSQSSEFLVIDLMKSLILIRSSSYFLIFSLLSLVGTNFKYLFRLIFSKYLFTYMKIIYKGFTL